MVANIYDMAKAFLSIEPMSNKKLQKLCYYAKAWHLALYDENIITEPFEAWVHGPVNPELYDRYKKYGWETINEDIEEKNIPVDFSTFAKQVYSSYGHMDADELEIVSHKELPWIEARGNRKPWESCHEVISETTMKEYYRKKVS
jgi:uncharacterized phage-associated protein